MKKAFKRISKFMNNDSMLELYKKITKAQVKDDLSMIRAAIDKQYPEPVLCDKYEAGVGDEYECPICGCLFDEFAHDYLISYCYSCGQKLSWEN